MSVGEFDEMIRDRQKELDRELRLCLKQLNAQLEEFRKVAVRTQTPQTTMLDSKGDYAWAPLVIAKAHILHALVMMDQEKNSRENH